DDGGRGGHHCDGGKSRVARRIKITMERAMENTPIPKYTVSFGLSLALACVINALLVVAKEKIPSLMAGMQKLTGHHWVSHSAIVLLLFALFGWLFARANGGRGINL